MTHQLWVAQKLCREALRRKVPPPAQSSPALGHPFAHTPLLQVAALEAALVNVEDWASSTEAQSPHPGQTNGSSAAVPPAGLEVEERKALEAEVAKWKAEATRATKVCPVALNMPQFILNMPASALNLLVVP